MTTNNTINWGIIGCGDVCEVKSGPGFQQAEGSNLVAVMRRDQSQARDYAIRHDVPCWYADADDLINDENIDAVYIATPPRYHMEYTLRVAEAGKPVYVEKPMALNYVQCQKMIAACQQAGQPLFVAYYRRALPRFLKVKKLLETGRIGPVNNISVVYHRPPNPEDTRLPRPWRLDPKEAPGGYFDDLAPHTIDILQYLVGNIETVNGLADNRAGNYQVPDYVTGSFQFASGITGRGEWYFSAEKKIDLINITGASGNISCSTFGNAPIRLETDKGIESYEISNPKTIQQPLIQTIVDHLLNRGQCPSTGMTAARTNWVMDQLLTDF